MGIGFADNVDDLPPALLVPGEALLPDQRAFLNAYLATTTIHGAAKLSKIHHLHHYQWMDEDPNYSLAFTRIRAIVLDYETDAIKKRGVDGYDEPLSYKGQLTGAKVRKYSDTIAIAYLKANRPEWRDGNAATSAAPVSIAITYPAPTPTAKPTAPASISGPKQS